VFPSKRAVLFIDGDFWHGNQWRLRGLKRLEDQFGHSANSSYWISKIRRNMKRDRTVTRFLKKLGWRVIRCWESEVNGDLEACAQRVMKQISDE
jgi:DNA mismatch endonuclease (patch repair protein)